MRTRTGARWAGLAACAAFLMATPASAGTIISAPTTSSPHLTITFDQVTTPAPDNDDVVLSPNFVGINADWSGGVSPQIQYFDFDVQTPTATPGGSASESTEYDVRLTIQNLGSATWNGFEVSLLGDLAQVGLGGTIAWDSALNPTLEGPGDSSPPFSNSLPTVALVGGTLVFTGATIDPGQLVKVTIAMDLETVVNSYTTAGPVSDVMTLGVGVRPLAVPEPALAALVGCMALASVLWARRR